MNFPFEIVKLFCRSFLSFVVIFCCFLIVCCFVMPSASWFRCIRAKRKKGQVEKDADDDVVFDTEEGVVQRVIEDDETGKDERRRVRAKQKTDRRRIIEDDETEDVKDNLYLEFRDVPWDS